MNIPCRSSVTNRNEPRMISMVQPRSNKVSIQMHLPMLVVHSAAVALEVSKTSLAHLGEVALKPTYSKLYLVRRLEVLDEDEVLPALGTLT
jgi:hypothetical protein